MKEPWGSNSTWNTPSPEREEAMYRDREDMTGGMLSRPRKPDKAAKVVEAAKAWASDIDDKHDPEDPEDVRGGSRQCNRCFVDYQLFVAVHALADAEKEK